MPSHTVRTVDLQELLQDELRREGTRRARHVREAVRYSGVAWSGLAPDPWIERSDDRILAEAVIRLEARTAWRTSRDGRLVAALSAAQRAAARSHLDCEAGKAAVSRGLPAETDACLARVSSLEKNARRLLAAARSAKRALRGSPEAAG